MARRSVIRVCVVGAFFAVTLAARAQAAPPSAAGTTATIAPGQSWSGEVLSDGTLSMVVKTLPQNCSDRAHAFDVIVNGHLLTEPPVDTAIADRGQAYRYVWDVSSLLHGNLIAQVYVGNHRDSIGPIEVRLEQILTDYLKLLSSADGP